MCSSQPSTPRGKDTAKETVTLACRAGNSDISVRNVATEITIQLSKSSKVMATAKAKENRRAAGKVAARATAGERVKENPPTTYKKSGRDGKRLGTNICVAEVGLCVCLQESGDGTNNTTTNDTIYGKPATDTNTDIVANAYDTDK